MGSTSLEENTMTEGAGKQTSKWDLAAEIIQDHTQPGEAGESCQDKETNSAWESSKSAGSDVPKWPDIEADNNTMSKDFSGWSKWEHTPGNKDEGKGGDVNRDGGEITPTTRMDCGDRSWGKGIPPDPDAWRQRSRSPSPKNGWSRSHRTRSRSPHGFKHETDGWNDRSRSRTGGSTAPCRNFAAGRCRRGSQCRFLHQDVHDYDDRRYGGGPAENRASRQEKGGSPGHASDEAFTDSHEQEKRYDVHGSHYDGHPEKHESQRSTRSSELCNNFLKGRCHRGSACRFVHDSASADGYNEWSSKAGKRERPHDTREPDNSFGRDWRRETRRNSDIPCKYFAGGYCRSGENCKFSHNTPVVDGPEGRSRGDKFSHDLVSENQSWDGPKWSERPDAQHAHNSPQRRNDNNGVGVSASENRSWDGPKWSDKAPGKNISNSSQWRSNDSVGWGMEESRCNPEDLQSRNPKEDMKHEISPKVVTETILPTYKQNLTQEVSGQQKHVPTGMMQLVASENAYTQQYPGQNGQRQQIPAPSVVQSFNPNAQSQQMGLLHPNVQSLNPNSQNQQIVPPIRNGQNFNPNGLSQQIIPQPPLNKKSDLADADMSPVTSVTPTAPNAATSEQVPQLTNLSASLAQILGNGLYASLNHLSNTGVVPSLPCPHPNHANPLAQTAAHVQPNQVSWSQKQYDPICDSIEPVRLDINDRPPGFPLNPHEQKGTAIEESQASVQSLAPPTTGGPNDGDCHRSGGSLQENLHQNRELKSRDPRVKGVGEQQTGQSEKEQKMGQSEQERHLRQSEKERQTGQSEKEQQTGQSEKEQQTGQSEKEQQTGHLKDMDADCEADEEGKRSKDEKGMRLFKFALVEFVKELLKPAWKEGHLSREAHKTIVKKTVDKVTGAIQAPQIPQTQEKVDLYLSHSKTKLTKLVQAYVGKYSKT